MTYKSLRILRDILDELDRTTKLPITVKEVKYDPPPSPPFADCGGEDVCETRKDSGAITGDEFDIANDEALRRNKIW